MSEAFAREGLADVWTPVALSSEVGKRPFALQVAGERVALFRNEQGQVGALVDRCPHRGVALSLGKVGKDGCLECPFHGWRFAADGACTHVPLNPMPAEKRKHLAATAFPVRERGGLVWLYTRPGVEAPEEPAVPAVLEDKANFTSFKVVSFRTHWSRAMENMLDVPHLPYVHRATIGRDMRAHFKPDSQMELDMKPTPTGWKLTWTVDGRPGPAALDWARPNGMVLQVSESPPLRMHVWCVPEGQNTTRLFIVNASPRNLLFTNPLSRWFSNLSTHRILLEDKGVVETSSPEEVPPASLEKSVATDKPTLAFRRWYLERVRPYRQQQPAELSRAS
jgi:phenylpropionate dioxygenase-like ring-hydroxylating dioxygenase large terminal subunit